MTTPNRSSAHLQLLNSALAASNADAALASSRRTLLRSHERIAETQAVLEAIQPDLPEKHDA